MRFTPPLSSSLDLGLGRSFFFNLLIGSRYNPTQMRTKTIRATYCEIVHCHRSTHRGKNDSFPLSLIIQNLIGEFSRFWWGLGNSDEIWWMATEGFPWRRGHSCLALFCHLCPSLLPTFEKPEPGALAGRVPLSILLDIEYDTLIIGVTKIAIRRVTR